MQQITCTNELPGGTRCGKPAQLVSTQFVYRQQYIEGQFEQILSEVHYNIKCPHCGQYTLVKTGGAVEEISDIAGAENGTSPDSSERRERQINGAQRDSQ